jgi:germination protein M
VDQHRIREQGRWGMVAGVLAVVLMMGLFVSGCDTIADSPGGKETVTLYFGDKDAMYLVPETRTIDKKDGTLEAAVIEELLKGPQKEGSVPTIPEGTKVLSLTVVNGVANVDFSKEFQTRHRGGSAGEIMTIYSVVNTLTELPGVEKVQFLLEGDKLESILGHMDTTVPIEPDSNLVEK